MDKALRLGLLLFVCVVASLSLSCGSGIQIQQKRRTCAALTGTPWSPSVPGTGASNHNTTTTTVTKSVQNLTAKVAGGSDLPTGSNLTTMTFTLGDLGVSGSFSLQAKVDNAPNPDLAPYPVLVSLVDPNGKDWVNLKSACTTGGVYTCSSSGCSVNSACGPDTSSALGTAYSSRTHWIQSQIPVFGSTSMNIFPTCNWASGTPSCAFNSIPFFSSSKLPQGTYTAKYYVLEPTKTTNNTNMNLKVTLTTKTDNVALGGGHTAAIDFNVVLVGNKIINASRTARGSLNLNILFEQVRQHYIQTNSNIKIGSINAYEWTCENGGDEYASPSVFDLGDVYQVGSGLLGSTTEGKAVNIFMVSRIEYGSDSSLTVLGLSGGLPGSNTNPDPASGVGIATFDMLDSYNSTCTAVSCSGSALDNNFVTLASTVSHEVGHYLGLNHPQESSATTNDTSTVIGMDAIADTPLCSLVAVTGKTGFYTTHASCRTDGTLGALTASGCNAACPGYNGSTTFCASATQCQFNHLMWWTTQNRSQSTGNGDGTIFSANTGVILNANPTIY